jgi:hypothetical protein
MTTNSQNLEESVSVSEGTTVSQGVNNNSNEEPTGQYPKSEYFFSSNLNYAATGAARNELYTGGGDLGLSLGLNEQGASEYPYNQVSETLSGHVIEVDDTPGNERILIKHRSGSGVELRSDGTVLVASTKNKVELTADDHTVVVEGEGNLVYKGNLNLKVTGDFNVECANFNVKSHGGYNMDVASSHRTKVGGNLGETVGGGSSRTSVGQVTNTSLGGFSNNVKGVYSNNVDGEANYVASGLTTLTSEDKINISTPDLNAAATNLSIFGDVGTIGGENIIMYNYNMYTQKNIRTLTLETTSLWADENVTATAMYADTFHGDLNGVAVTATVAQSQAYADPVGGGGTGSAGSITNTAADPAAIDAKVTAMPSAQLLETYLTKSQNGVRIVAIDDGDFIKNNIDKTNIYGGLSNLDLTTGLVRSRLRDQSNLNVEDFTSRAIAEGVLSPNYVKVAPTGIGRVVSGDSTPKFGQMKFGNVKVTSSSDPFLPRRLKANLIPDPVYNPDFQLAITSGTKLAPGVTMAKFLGSTGHATNLEFIKDPQQRKDLARQLYLHAEVMRSVATNKSTFADYRLLVQEGVYRPGPSETPSGLNALKLSGQAVVYDLVDLSGRSDPAVIFDLAEYWKDTLYFDKLILSYDTYDPDKELDAQIIIIMPEIDEDWVGVFNRNVETQFNGKKMADGELVECITSPTLPETTSVDPLPDQGGKYGVTTNKVLKPLLYSTNGASPYLQPGALENMQRLLSNEYAALQKEFGAALTINDGLAKVGTGRSTNPPSSQHFYGRAIDIDITSFNNEKRRKLVDAALKVGFTGIGLGNNIIHLDVRPASRRTGRAGDRDAWNYSNAKFAGLSFDGYWNDYIET